MDGATERRVLAGLGALAAVALLVAAVAGGALPVGASDDEALVAQAVGVRAGDVATMDALLLSIEDPIVRQAALVAWLDAHGAEQPVTVAIPLCERLEGAGRVVCLRKAASPHLTGSELGGEPRRDRSPGGASP
jgi:hypothetical protein